MSKSTRSRCRRPFPSDARFVTLALLGSLAASGADAAPDVTSCHDVQVGSARSYDCINQALRNRVVQLRPPADSSVTSAASPANRVGTFNQSATREYLGSSFGHSAAPQPHLHTYTPPLTLPGR